MSKQHISLLLSAILIYASIPGTAEASRPRDDGLYVAVPGPPDSELPLNALKDKSRVVRPKREVLNGNRIRLNLGVGPDLEMIRERPAEHRYGRKAWIGRVIGDPDSEVILASNGDAVAGTIRRKGRLYKLEPAANGRSVIAEVGPGDPLPEMDPLPVGDVAGQGTSGEAVPSAQGDGGTVVDVMVVYTPATKVRYGGTSGVEALVTLAVAETDQAYLNSQVDARLRLVHTAEVSYTESGSMNGSLR